MLPTDCELSLCSYRTSICTSIAALAPLSAHYAVLEKGCDALQALQAGLAELVYCAALHAALAPPAPPQALENATPLTMQQHSPRQPPSPPLSPPRLLAPRLQFEQEGPRAGALGGTGSLAGLPQREGLNLALGAGAAAWDRRARFTLNEEAGAEEPASPPPPLARAMPSPWAPTSSPQLVGVGPPSPLRVQGGASGAHPSTSASPRLKDRVRRGGAQSLHPCFKGASETIQLAASISCFFAVAILLF